VCWCVVAGDGGGVWVGWGGVRDEQHQQAPSCECSDK
jgi:hypothetical protein